METREEDFLPEHTEIPKRFYSDATGGLFETCVHCHRNLLNPKKQYVIEKVIKLYEEVDSTDTIFEYAICIDCYQELRSSLSKESMERMGEYLNRNTDLEGRRNRLMESGNLDIDAWISNCIVKDKPMHTCREFQVMCECFGDQMLFTMMPYMISDDALEEMSMLLSDETQGFFDDFRKTHLGPPPEVSELLKPSRVILL